MDLVLLHLILIKNFSIKYFVSILILMDLVLLHYGIYAIVFNILDVSILILMDLVLLRSGNDCPQLLRTKFQSLF